MSSVSEPRILRIELPGITLLNANNRVSHFTRAKLVKDIKAQMSAAVKKAAPEPFPGKVRIRAMYSPPNRHDRDADNIFLTAKACIDSLVPLVIPDDNSRYVSEVCCAISNQVIPGGLMVIQVIENDSGS